MAQFQSIVVRPTALLAAVLLATSAAHAATSLSNSLRGFTGDSTQAATQTAVMGAGFDFFSVDGLAADFSSDPAVTFDSAGAHFGMQFAVDGSGGDGGRNYMRTIESDYATASFVAEVTVDIDMGTGDSPLQQAFFGMGAGDTALYGVPDWSLQGSSTFVTPERGFLKTWSSSNDVNVWNDNDPVAALTGAGTHRMRMSFNSTTHAMTYAIDLNYSGGAFTADYTAPALVLDTINCPEGCGGGTDANFFDPVDGWPAEPSKIFFGGDDQVTFKDFSVTVGSAANANFNGDAIVNGADFLLWQKGNGITTGATPAQGDADGNGAVNAADLGFWENQFGTAPLVGSLSSAPEPSSCLIAGMAIFGSLACRRAGHAPRAKQALPKNV